MSTVEAKTWIPTGNDYVIDGLWGRLGVQEFFGETYVSGATNGLAVKDAGDKVFVYAGSVNGGIHLRIYDKGTDSWGDRWQWVSKPGSNYEGSQSIGVLTISDDGQYLAVGQGNPSNYGGIGAPSQGVQIGAIQDDGSVNWLATTKAASEVLEGETIRSMEWVGDTLIATSVPTADGGFLQITTSAEGVTTAKKSPLAFAFLSRGSNYSFMARNDGSMSITPPNGIRFNELTGDKYHELKTTISKSNEIVARTAVHNNLIDGKLIAYIGTFANGVKTPIASVIRLVIDPQSRELINFRSFNAKAGEIGTDQASNIDGSYGNFSLAVDLHDPTGNAVFVGGNQFGSAKLASPTFDGGLVRVDFGGEEPGISDRLYGPWINNEEILVPDFSPGQPHADSRTIAFYESTTGPKLLQTDDGGIWQLELEVREKGSTPRKGAWWQSLTTRGLNTLETNMVSWASATNSIASSYQDNAASLGYYGDDHATNLWNGDGQLAFFDDSDESEAYSGYLSSQGYIADGIIGRFRYSKDGYITSQQNALFYLQRPLNQTPIPWQWSPESQVPGAEGVFMLPTEPHAYKENSIALSGQLNIYETIKHSGSLPENALVFRPLLEKDFEPIEEDGKFKYLSPTAMDNQGGEKEGAIGSLYVGALNGEGRPTIYGRESNSLGKYTLIDLFEDQEAFSELGSVVDIAHNHQSSGDTIYWIQGGNALNVLTGFVPEISAEDQILGYMTPGGQMITRGLKQDLGVEFIPNDTYGYQALVFVPGRNNRGDQLIIGGLNGIWSIKLDDDGQPIGKFARMPWQGLEADKVPGSYVKTIQYDPQDDLLIAGTQGQGSFIYSFSGELGQRSQSDELLHISDITLAQSSSAALDKRGNQTNSTIVIQLNSELQSKTGPTEVEIILNNAEDWRTWMELVSPYDISLSTNDIQENTTAGQTALQYLNILDPLGLKYRGGREEDGNIIMPFTFPAGMSLYSLTINQKEFAYPRDTISLSFSVQTIDGLDKKSAMLQLVPESPGISAVFNGSSLAFKKKNFFINDVLSGELTEEIFASFIHPEEYKVLGSNVINSYTITPTIMGSGAVLPTASKNHETRTTLPIDTYPILREDIALNSGADPKRWLFASLANAYDQENNQVKLEQLITYDSTNGFGARFYELSGDGYADYLSISANASQTEFSEDVALVFGSVEIQPRFKAIDRQQVALIGHENSDELYAFNIRINASVELGKRPAITSSVGYMILNAYENLIDFSNTLFKERAKTLITILGEPVDLSAIPESGDFRSEILINNGQRVMFFEVEGGSLDQLTGLDDPRLSWFESEVVPDQNGEMLALSNANQTALTVKIRPGVQGINPLIADLQNQAPILDFTAFATDQTITGKLAYGREAALDSTLGWYVISRVDGAITATNGDTLLPGHASYGQEALRAENLVDSLTGIQVNDGEVDSKDFSIKGGTLLAPYAKVSNGETYFAFAPANSDGLEHFYSLGTNKIGFEDLKGGGDLDFQDLVQMFDFKIDWIA